MHTTSVFFIILEPPGARNHNERIHGMSIAIHFIPMVHPYFVAGTLSYSRSWLRRWHDFLAHTLAVGLFGWRYGVS